MDGEVTANALIQLHITPDEAVVLMHCLGGEDDFVGERIRSSGMLPDNHEAVAFEMQEKIRKLHRKIQQ